MTPDIHKAGILVLDDQRVLLCERRGKPAPLTLPGGKLEPGETELQCLARELREELGDVTATRLIKLGSYAHHTADTPPRTIRIELYAGGLAGAPKPSSEIARLVWFGPEDDAALLPPSLREVIFPDLMARGILPWPSRPAAPPVRGLPPWSTPGGS
jgi:8-oxo-dGTP pyrophosphatase MutT (NUDIX family)